LSRSTLGAMRLGRISGRSGLVAVAAVAICAGVGFAFSPVVRARVADEARRKHLAIDVGGVRPGWFAVVLRDVSVQAEGVDAAKGHFDELRVELDWRLRARAMRIRGGQVTADGSAAEIAKQVGRWRSGWEGSHVEGEPSADGGLTIAGDRLVVAWTRPDGRIDATGVSLERHGDELRVGADAVHAHVGRAAVEAERGQLVLASSMVRHVGAAALRVSESATQDDAGAAQRAAETPSTHGSDADPPAMPDLHELRADARAVASALSGQLPVDADVDVSALTIAMRRGDTDVELGPGELRAAHRRDGFELRFTAQPSAPGATALALRAELPVDAGDVSLSMEGGPVTLARLGLKEGTAGLIDTDRAELSGRARVTLSDAGDSLTFDGDVRVRGLGLDQPRIARDRLHGLDVGLASRGVLDGAGNLRIDDFAATMGAVELSGSGELDRLDPSHFAAHAQLEVPTASCQSMFESLPSALVPTLSGARYEGTFGAHGRFALDSKKLDDAIIDYAIGDDCRVVGAPETVARERFLSPFQHRIYLPDGTISEETTGPGTSKWVRLAGISPFMQVAVQTTEDGGFYHHHGFSHPAIKASVIANLKARRFVRGASTITMQLAKNLFLEREKTLSRKFEEMLLADYLEQVFSKSELMELYLNVVEFGPSVYGIKAASYYYFGRSPGELDLAECLFLSSMLPSPLKLSGLRGEGELDAGWQKILVRLMEIAHKNGLISDAELEDGKGEVVVFRNTGPRSFAQRHNDPIGDDGTDAVAQEPRPN
jgi:hypothetical protein